MAKEKELVVIVDEEARKTLEPLGFRYFAEAKRKRDRTYVIKTPLGKKRKVEGTLVRKPNLEEHAAEYIYLEVTDYCNFSCNGCGVSKDLTHVTLTKLIDKNAKYITPEFIEAFSRLTKNQPFHAMVRRFFYGGGEPLINPHEFRRVINGFSDLERTIHVVLTNGCNIPLDPDEFRSYVDGIGNPYIFITYTKEHERQYADLARTKRFPVFIPADVPPEDALKQKIKVIGNNCNDLGIGFTANVVKRGNSQIETDLRNYILKQGINIFVMEFNGHRDPCSRGQEIAIRYNGDIYPHCYNIFTKTEKIGIVGLLVR